VVATRLSALSLHADRAQASRIRRIRHAPAVFWLSFLTLRQWWQTLLEVARGRSHECGGRLLRQLGDVVSALPLARVLGVAPSLPAVISARSEPASSTRLSAGRSDVCSSGAVVDVLRVHSGSIRCIAVTPTLCDRLSHGCSRSSIHSAARLRASRRATRQDVVFRAGGIAAHPRASLVRPGLMRGACGGARYHVASEPFAKSARPRLLASAPGRAEFRAFQEMGDSSFSVDNGTGLPKSRPHE